MEMTNDPSKIYDEQIKELESHKLQLEQHLEEINLHGNNLYLRAYDQGLRDMAWLIQEKLYVNTIQFATHSFKDKFKKWYKENIYSPKENE